MSYKSNLETPQPESRRLDPRMQTESSKSLIETVEVSAPSARSSSSGKVFSDISIEPMTGMSPVHEAEDLGVDPGLESVTEEAMGESVTLDAGKNLSTQPDQPNFRSKRRYAAEPPTVALQSEGLGRVAESSDEDEVYAFDCQSQPSDDHMLSHESDSETELWGAEPPNMLGGQVQESGLKAHLVAAKATNALRMDQLAAAFRRHNKKSCPTVTILAQVLAEH